MKPLSFVVVGDCWSREKLERREEKRREEVCVCVCEEFGETTFKESSVVR